MELGSLVSACCLNQWVLDFDGNYERIRRSIIDAKARNAKIRLGSELEVTGYGCRDHFYEIDTYTHSWEVVAKLLGDTELYGILIFLGMPVLFKGHRYSGVTVMMNGEILLIRPKKWLSVEGRSEHPRWFSTWADNMKVENYTLPDTIKSVKGQKETVIGDALLELNDTTIGIEIGEEMNAPRSPHSEMYINGAEIIVNASGNYHEIGKLEKRVNSIVQITTCFGGAYLYSNQRGCSSGNTYFDGAPMVVYNGEVMAIGKQFSLSEYEVVVANLDLNEVTSYRSQRTIIKDNFSSVPPENQGDLEYPKVRVKFNIKQSYDPCTDPIQVVFLTAEEEMNLASACWMWDYLRRSRQGGYFIALSGGIDSCSVLMMTYSMCRLVYNAIKDGDEAVLGDLREIIGNDAYFPESPREISNYLIHTAYMSTENSTTQSRNRACMVAAEVGCYHMDFGIDQVITTVLALFVMIMNKTPKFTAHGGSVTENLALQNIQARIRMVLSYFVASLILWVRGRKKLLLTLSTANSDEIVRGYLTKYDNSSGDLNPIGSYSKMELRNFIAFSCKYYQLSVLNLFLDSTPSAELVPTHTPFVQCDEVEMGMSYDDLFMYTRLRTLFRLGPYFLFKKLCNLWSHDYSPYDIAVKVKTFFHYYSINRHKSAVSTPIFHSGLNSSGDNCSDLRPILYNSDWTWQFLQIDKELNF